ncbi:hypothetical protein [Arthrobacter ulcerisalmonis]|uniref:hypothetical protein n=1 Tax=Arthrobacter ulcerisalmonis TaxID=2483813 RepID=UPI003636190F
MAIEKSLIQPEPVISAIINGDNTGVLKINGEEHPYEAPEVNDLRQALMKRVIGEAATLGRPVRVTSMDDTGVSYLVVSPAGEVEEEQPATVPENASAIIERIPSIPAATTTVAGVRPLRRSSGNQPRQLHQQRPRRLPAGLSGKREASLLHQVPLSRPRRASGDC